MNSATPFDFLLFMLFMIAGAVALVYFFMYRTKESKTNDQSYLEALKYMAEGESRRAIEKFKETVRTDSENSDAYIKLGIILRDAGLVKNAIRIHKDLTLRGNLPATVVNEVYRQLGLDYWNDNNLEQAEFYFTKLKSDSRYQSLAAEYLIRIHTRRQDYDKAFAAMEKLPSAQTTEGKSILAMYKVLSANKLVSEGEEKEARIVCKDGLKIDPQCAAAYLEIGDSYQREGRMNDAITSWKQICNKIPNQAYLAFERLEKALYDIGQFEKMEEIYSDLLGRDGNNIEALIGLSELYRKKGEYNEAIRLLNEFPQKELASKKIHAQTIRIMIEQGKLENAGREMLHFLDGECRVFNTVFECKSCRHTSEQLFWICPKCDTWNKSLFS
jgi:lipopolysaccharide biosynthesis regulator YciM